MGCERIPLPAVQLLYNVSNFKPETVIAIALLGRGKSALAAFVCNLLSEANRILRIGFCDGAAIDLLTLKMSDIFTQVKNCLLYTSPSPRDS